MTFLDEDRKRWVELEQTVENKTFNLISCTNLNESPKYEQRWDSNCTIKPLVYGGNFELNYISRQGQPYVGNLSCGSIINFTKIGNELSIVTRSTIWNFKAII
jgi:hypothetical protein